jgi:hypothetical protein
LLFPSFLDDGVEGVIKDPHARFTAHLFPVITWAIKGTATYIHRYNAFMRSQVLVPRSRRGLDTLIAKVSDCGMPVTSNLRRHTNSYRVRDGD